MGLIIDDLIVLPVCSKDNVVVVESVDAVGHAAVVDKSQRFINTLSLLPINTIYLDCSKEDFENFRRQAVHRNAFHDLDKIFFEWGPIFSMSPHQIF